jgi:hypothetical protein
MSLKRQTRCVKLHYGQNGALALIESVSAATLTNARADTPSYHGIQHLRGTYNNLSAQIGLGYLTIVRSSNE